MGISPTLARNPMRPRVLFINKTKLKLNDVRKDTLLELVKFFELCEASTGFIE